MIIVTSLDHTLCADAPGLVASTRFPVERRTFKIHNVEAALLALEEHGCQIHVSADEIVNGVRSSTLQLLWILLSRCQVIYPPPPWAELMDVSVQFLTPQHCHQALEHSQC